MMIISVVYQVCIVLDYTDPITISCPFHVSRFRQWRSQDICGMRDDLDSGYVISIGFIYFST